MNEISELKDDLAFLRKIDSRNNSWKEFDGPNRKEKVKVRSNFLLHPKRLSSDSEISSHVSSPRKFFSATLIKTSNLLEPNNNVRKQINCHSAQVCQVNIVQDCYTENAQGDVLKQTPPSTKIKSTQMKSAKFRPSSSCVQNYDKKFKLFAERSLKVLSNIRMMLEEGIPLPDGEADYFRRTKRLQEFSGRFSRIYLYPLLRQMDELSLPEKLSMAAINQKFLNAQQIILQGLQAYYTHLPSSIGKCGSDKLQSLLDQIMYMCHLYDMLQKNSSPENWEFINAMRNHVELLLETLTIFSLKFDDKKPKPQSQNEIIKKGSKTSHSKLSGGSKAKSKLSMYLHNSSHKKELEFKRGLKSLKKYSVTSKYKTAGFKHRPPVEKQGAANVPERMKLFHKGSSGQLKATPVKMPVREDDIKTMVEVDAELEAPPNTGENPNPENSVASGRQLVQDSDRNPNDGIGDGNVEKALEILRIFFGNCPENRHADFLESIACEVDKKKEKKEGTERRNDQIKKMTKGPIVTVTGAKNAKLICIRDDNSAEEDVYRKDKEVMTDAELKLTSSETQTEMNGLQTKRAIKISRLPKNIRKMLNLLPQQYAINIIQYKLRYNQFHKHNSMYRKSTHIQPWVLMGQISDDILNHALQSVTMELEVNEILEKLYNAEFQY